jgi:chorismate mutase/prephenate dehydratase
MTTADTRLDDLRQEVDEIDAAIHDLILRRADLLGDRLGPAAFRPAREAQVLRALISRHRGGFPRRVLVRLWREMISALTGMHDHFAVAAFVPEEGPDLRRVARDHFGSETPITPCESIMSVLRQVTEKHASVGVLPLPQEDESDPWWRHLARGGEAVPRIVARLPFAVPDPAAPGASEIADSLVIAFAEYEPSGQDRSFLVVETGEQISRSKLSRQLGEAGLAPVNIQGWAEPSGQRLHLIEIDGFLSGGDERLRRLGAREDGDLLHSWAIGGYALPLTREQLADPKTKARG